MKDNINKLIEKLGKIEDKLAVRINGDFKIKEGSFQEKKLVSERLKIKDKINKNFLFK